MRIDLSKSNTRTSLYFVVGKEQLDSSELWIATFCSQGLAELFIEECQRWDTLETESA